MTRGHFAGVAIGFLFAASLAAQQLAPPKVGPETEKRFPKLLVPKGFSPTLFACDPLIEYPSVISLGPRYGSLFVAHDYVTGLGVKIVKRDEVRLIEDTDGDGYADKSTVFAGEFNSIQGLAFDGTAVYVMHAPLLTRVEDIDGDGVADRRKNLIDGLGLPPEKNSNRLHCANGVVLGHDGWLYLALGDRGCDVVRPEGNRLVFREGGILRVQPDGSHLHVFCGGLRNIYDVALDDQLNVFVRDNENDGGDYMVRVCQCFFGSDHGYPYLYNERPRQALPPLADLGRGSSAGGTAYLETSFPAEFRRSLFFCEWGRSVVTYKLTPKGSRYEQPREVDFATTAGTDPYGFKPTDVVVDWDGSLLVSDWCDGQRPKRGRGRIYRIAANPPRRLPQSTASDGPFGQLDSPSYLTRCVTQRKLLRKINQVAPQARDVLKKARMGWRARSHLVWMLAQARRGNEVNLLTQVAREDPDPRVRVQAIRAIADWCDPLLDQATTSQRRTAFDALTGMRPRDARVKLAVFVAVRRLGLPVSVSWLRQNARNLDRAQVHALQQCLGNGLNAETILQLLDEPSQPVGSGFDIHEVATLAAADRFDRSLVDGLLQRAARSSSSRVRSLCLDVLALVHRKPKPWVYWGFRPAPRQPATREWARTVAIRNALEKGLRDADFGVREMAARRMLREKIPLPLEPVVAWLKKERKPEHVSTALRALQSHGPKPLLEQLPGIILDRNHANVIRREAVRLYASALGKESRKGVMQIAAQLEDGPLLAQILADLPPSETSQKFLNAKTGSTQPVVAAAALRALHNRNHSLPDDRLLQLLAQKDLRVLRAAVALAKKQKTRAAEPFFLGLAKSADPELCSASLQALRELQVSTAVPQAVSALRQAGTQPAALGYLERFGNAGHRTLASKAADDNLAMDVQRAALRALHAWNINDNPDATVKADLQRRIARIQMATGTPIRWQVYRPDSRTKPDRLFQQVQTGSAGSLSAGYVFSQGLDADVRWEADPMPSQFLVAASRLWADKVTEIELLASSEGPLIVYLNETRVLERGKGAKFRADSDRRTTRLRKGLNQLIVHLPAPTRRFQVRFRQRSSKQEHELLTAAILTGKGNPERGRELFHNSARAQCIRCHRLGSEGGNIGPDLSGVGRRFSKIHLLESILEPSRSIAPSYRGITLRLNSGRILTGIVVKENNGKLTLGDSEGKLQIITSADIDASTPSELSVMPTGLEKRLSQRQLADLIAYLMSQKAPAQPGR